ncbi:MULTISPECIES: M3 family oligoendopeptidase [unclassified Bacillus (in: firmicutes)]|uniref:M3 family oligoendopeptidase n=1 Tax=unclassified Bacillus (in: firmicutes) TaxID=185979 RepID=UPI001FCD06F8|nr:MULTISPECIES: M3 family oligoendopeptidase [unclassified Bacillus (in: firmicutes)]
MEALQQQFEDLLQTEIQCSEELESWLKRQSRLLDEVEEQLKRHYIQFQCNTHDQQAKEAFDFDQKHVQPLVKRYKSLLDSKYYESPFRLQLDPKHFGLLNKKVENAIRLFNEKNIDLEIEEDELVTKYFEITGNLTVMWEDEEKSLSDMEVYLQDPERTVRKNAMTLIQKSMLSVEEDLQIIMDKLIALRHQKAQNVGLPNYRDYMFRKYERFDYTAADCHELAEAMRQYVVPLQKKLQEKQQNTLGLNTFRPWDIRAVPINEKPLQPVQNVDELVKGTFHILEKVDSRFSALLHEMKEKNLLDLESRKGKAPGGFCESLPVSKQSFIFMNCCNTQDDVVVLLHEMGHCIHNELMKDIEPQQYRNVPMESAELASTTMELLTMEYWNTFYPSGEDFKRAKREQLRLMIQYLPIITVVDQFQHWMYENPNHTHVERRAKFKELARTYDSNFVNWEGYENWLETKWLSILHIFEVPFYYIEYAIAQIGALQMYKQYKEDPKQTLIHYKQALSLGSTQSVKEVYEAAGIRFDFSAQTIKELMEFVEKELELFEEE